MRQIIFFALLIFAATANAQIRWTAGIPYTTNAPTHTPSATGSLWAIDTATLDLYAYYGGAWNLTGERIQTISGCTAPAYTPGKGQSLFVINGCDSLYYYRSGSWAHINPGGTGGGGGATNLTFSETLGVFILNSNTGSDVGFKPGNGIGITRLNDTITISATDASATNEGLLSVGAGTATTSLIQSNTSGSNTVTLSAGSNITLSENTTTNTITITGKNGIYGGDGDIPVGTEATVALNSTFELDYSNGANALEVKDLEGQTIITGKTLTDSVVVGASNILLRTPGQVQISGGSNAGAIRIMEPRGSGTNYTQIQSAAQSANITYTLPTTDGTNGQFLQFTTGGNLQWATPSGGGGGGGIDSTGALNTGATGEGVYSYETNNVLHFRRLIGGTGITLTGADSSITITNSAPDQTVVITGAGINTVTGTYPDFTVTGTEVDGSTTNEIQTLTIDSSTVNLVERFAIGITPSGNTIRIDVPQTMDGEVNGAFAATSVDTVRRVWFNRTYSQPDSLAKLQWSATDETLKLGIGETDLQTVVQIGQETLYPKVTNQTGSIIRKGTPVMVDSVAVIQGDNIRIRPAIGSTLQNVATVMGIAAHDISANSTGYVTWFGYVTEVDEANIAQTGITFAAGNILYLSATEAGKLTNVLPTAPNIKDPIAIVVRRPNSNNLTLLVRPQLTPDIHDVNDISISSPTAGQVLRYNSGGFWENGQVQAAGIANNSIDSTKIATGAISITDINQSNASTNQVLKWNGTQWAPAPDETASGSGTTDLTFTGTTSPYTLNSSSGTDVTFAQGSGIALSRNNNELSISATDASTTNEGSLTVGAGTSTTSIIQSNTSGSTNVTLEAGPNIFLSETGNTINIDAADTDLELSGGASPYFITSSTGSDVSIAQGNGITLSRSSNQLTITAADQSATNELQTLTLDSTISNGIEIFGITIGPSGNKINFQVPQPENGDKGEITVASNGTGWTIDNNVITNVKIADNAIDSNKIADGKVGLNDINSGFATNGQVLKWNGSNWRPGADDAGGVSDSDKGDITVSASGATWNIDAGVVANTELASGSGGIYKGSGDIPNATAAKVASAGSFTVDYNDGSDAIKVDDQLNTITLLDGTLSSTLSVEPTQAGITSNGTILNLTEQGVFITGDTIDITGVTTKLGFPGGSGTVTTSGTPTTDRLAKFTGSTVIGNSLISESGQIATVNATGALIVPIGNNTTQLPSPASNGMVRYDTDNNALEYYNSGASAWEVPLKAATATGLGSNTKLFFGNSAGRATFSDSLQFNNGILSINPFATGGSAPLQVGTVPDGGSIARGLRITPATAFNGRSLPMAVGIRDNRSLAASGASPSVNVSVSNSDVTNDNYAAFGFTSLLTNSNSVTFGGINCVFTSHDPTTYSGDFVFQLANNANYATVMTMKGNGNVGIGVTSPTAALHLKAGTATANSAPLKFTSGTNLTTAEAGAMEYNGTNLLFTPSTVRHTVNHGLTASATLDFGSTNAQNSADLTITVTGAADGDVVSLGVPNASVNANTCYTAWVSATNTVTVRFNNYSSAAVNPASGTFKVFVTK